MNKVILCARKEIVLFLLQHPALNVEIQSRDGSNILMQVLSLGSLSYAKALMESNRTFDMNVQTKVTKTISSAWKSLSMLMLER